MKSISKFRNSIAHIFTCFIPNKLIRRILRTYILGEKDYLKAIGFSYGEINNLLSINNEQIRFRIVQNELIKYENLNTKSLIVMIVPNGKEFMSGGIYSMFLIANYSKQLKNIHNSDVIIMTRLDKNGNTYCKQTNFKNDNIIYRFEQIIEYKNLENLIIHIPEESAAEFYSLLSNNLKEHLKKVKNIQINILDQNINLMPESKDFKDLYKITSNITQTVAHHRYCTQEFTNKYNIPSLLLVPYTDINNYQPIPFEQKENRILYSRDYCKYKKEIINTLSDKLGNKYVFQEINGISFDDYLELTRNSKFMITFGEGYDGYFAQSMLLGGVCFAVYNNEFFPKNFDFNKPNVFSSYEDMLNNIADRILCFDEMDTLERNGIINYFNDIQHKISQKDIFIKSLERFYKNDMDFYPQVANLINND